MILQICDEKSKELVFKSLENQFPGLSFQKAFKNFQFYHSKDTDYYLIPKATEKDLQWCIKHAAKNFVHAGIYLGRMRNEFGLSLEILPLLQQIINEIQDKEYSIQLDSQESQKFLYGREMEIKIKTFPLKKVFVLNDYAELIGLGQIKIKGENAFLRPIIDLGKYIRDENNLFRI